MSGRVWGPFKMGQRVRVRGGASVRRVVGIDRDLQKIWTIPEERWERGHSAPVGSGRKWAAFEAA